MAKAFSFLEGVAGNLPSVTPNYLSEPLTITLCRRDGRCGQLYNFTPFEMILPQSRVVASLRIFVSFDLLSLLFP